MRRGRGSQGIYRKIILAFIIVCVVMIMAGYISVKLVVAPNLEDVSKMRAEALISRTVSETLAKQFKEQKNEQDELFTVKKDKKGAMEMVQANSVEINIIMSELSVGLYDAFYKMERERFDVPVGSLMGNKFFSQMGPQVAVDVVPISRDKSNKIQDIY